MMKFQLIDYLAYKLNCRYISDLHFLPEFMVKQEVQQIPVEQCSLKEWEDLASYLCGEEKKFRLARDAKDFILNGKEAET